MKDNRCFVITPSEDGLFTFEKTEESIPFLQGWVKVIPENCRLPLPSSFNTSIKFREGYYWLTSIILTPLKLLLKDMYLIELKQGKGLPFNRGNI